MQPPLEKAESSKLNCFERCNDSSVSAVLIHLGQEIPLTQEPAKNESALAFGA
jgi:hypothetical protein